MKKRTISCKEVYDKFQALRESQKKASGNRITKKYVRVMKAIEELQDAFCDFECSWEQHAIEYHGATRSQYKKTKS